MSATRQLDHYIEKFQLSQSLSQSRAEALLSSSKITWVKPEKESDAFPTS